MESLDGVVVAPMEGSASQKKISNKEARTLKLYRDISQTLRYARKNKYDSNNVTNLILDPSIADQLPQRPTQKKLKKKRLA